MAWIAVRRSKVWSPAPAGVAVGEPAAHLLEHPVARTHGLADHEGPRILERLADLLAARHFADAGVAGAVARDDDVAGEERAVGAAQVEQHAVVPRDGDDAQVRDDGRSPDLAVRGISRGSWDDSSGAAWRREMVSVTSRGMSIFLLCRYASRVTAPVTGRICQRGRLAGLCCPLVPD